MAMSKSKLEYIVAAEVFKEALWLTWLVRELGVEQGVSCQDQTY